MASKDVANALQPRTDIYAKMLSQDFPIVSLVLVQELMTLIVHSSQIADKLVNMH